MPIFDQGYQHWQGPLSGHAWRWLTIALQGTRVQMKSRILRGFLFLAWLPALGLVVFMALWGLVEKKSEGVLVLLQNVLPPGILADPRAYRPAVWTMAYSYFFKTELFFIMLLVALAGPGLISRDLRFNALPLYFARPLNRFDYFLGKLGVIGTLVASVAVGPAVLAYIVGLGFSFDSAVIKDTWKLVLASVACGLVITLSAGTLILALSSLTRRSLYVGITWAGFWIVSSTTGTALTEYYHQMLQRDVFVAEREVWQAENSGPPGHRGGPKGQNARAKELREAVNKAREEQAEALRKDWRPLFSYVSNLERVSDWLLGTDAARESIKKVVASSREAAQAAFGPPGRRRSSDDDEPAPTYPWEWSAGVLTGLLGLSTWTLTSRVKSLDRLK
jgi:ABC-2 type transport system permease protein